MQTRSEWPYGKSFFFPHGPYIEGLKEKFFDSTFQAALDKSDELMLSQWQRKIDPHGVSKAQMITKARDTTYDNHDLDDAIF